MPAVRGGEREIGAHGGARFGRAVDNDASAQCRDAVLEAEQAGAACQCGAAAPIVALDGIDLDLDYRRLRVLSGVGQRLSNNVYAAISTCSGNCPSTRQCFQRRTPSMSRLAGFTSQCTTPAACTARQQGNGLGIAGPGRFPRPAGTTKNRRMLAIGDHNRLPPALGQSRARDQAGMALRPSCCW
jgi:hypothetical protein